MADADKSETLFEGRAMAPCTSEDAEILRFRFASGAILAACDPGAGKGVAVLVNSPSLPSGWIEATLSAMRRHVDPAKPGTLIKLIGTAPALAPLQAALSAHGISPTTRHELGEGSHEIYFYPRTGRARVSKAAPAPASAPAAQRRVRVLIIDDSKTIRDLMTRVLSSDPGIDVVGSADGPETGERMISELKPDVVTLDIHMPGMDGVTLLKKYLPKHPIPTVMISSISLEEGPMVLSALEAGAVEYIQKPSFDQLRALAPMIVEKIKAAAGAKVSVGRRTAAAPFAGSKAVMDQQRVIAIGSSTGGTEALRVLMSGLPERIPPVVIVQHIPPVFSKAFAMRMDDLFPFQVREAENGDEVRPDRILIAPGGKQMSVRRTDGILRAVIEDSAPVNRHKPSVDVLFNSVARELGASAVGVILTGMGADGARGLLEMRKTGSRTIAQDEASCVVYGMPREAFKLGGAEFVEPLDQIAGKLIGLLQPGAKAKKPA